MTTFTACRSRFPSKHAGIENVFTDLVVHVQVLAKENARIDPVVLALADLIAEQPDRLLPHIHFEGDYCLACDWRRLDLKESAEVLTLNNTHLCSAMS